MSRTETAAAPVGRDLTFGDDWRVRATNDVVADLPSGGISPDETRVRLPYDAMLDRRSPAATSGPMTGYHETSAFIYLTRHTRTVRLVTDLVYPDGEVVATDSSPVTVLPGAELQGALTRLVAHDDKIDEASTTFGLRTLQLGARCGLRLDREVINFRGAAIHHDNSRLGSTTIERADERRIELLKAAGFNAIRSPHNPASRALLDACDRLGVLVMSESFDVWTRGKADCDYSHDFHDRWRGDIEAMVASSKNHLRAVAAERIAEVSARGGEIASVLDIVGYNYADYRYEHDVAPLPYPIVVGSETFPSRVARYWELVTKRPFLSAMSGDLDIAGFRRPISYYREVVFGLRTDPYIAVQDPVHFAYTVTLRPPFAFTDAVSTWSWPGHKTQPVRVEVYADAAEVALVRDATEIARRTALSLSADRPVIRADDTDLAYVTVEPVDTADAVRTDANRAVTVRVEGPGICSATARAIPRPTSRSARPPARPSGGVRWPSSVRPASAPSR